jgi:hypothetical protein
LTERTAVWISRLDVNVRLLVAASGVDDAQGGLVCDERVHRAGDRILNLLIVDVEGVDLSALSGFALREVLRFFFTDFFSDLLADLLAGLLAGFLAGFFARLLAGLFSGLLAGLFSGFLAGFLAGLFSGFFAGLFSGFFAGLLAGFLAGLFSGLFSGLLAGLLAYFFGSAAGVFRGTRSVGTTDQANAGDEKKDEWMRKCTHGVAFRGAHEWTVVGMLGLILTGLLAGLPAGLFAGFFAGILAHFGGSATRIVRGVRSARQPIKAADDEVQEERMRKCTHGLVSTGVHGIRGGGVRPSGPLPVQPYI